MPIEDLTIGLARDILRFRRARSSFLPSGVFGEPAWDLLMLLYAAQAVDEPITLRSAIEEIDVPPGVMRRWISYLVNRELVLGNAVGDLDEHLTLSSIALKKIRSLLDMGISSQQCAGALGG